MKISKILRDARPLLKMPGKREQAFESKIYLTHQTLCACDAVYRAMRLRSVSCRGFEEVVDFLWEWFGKDSKKGRGQPWFGDCKTKEAQTSRLVMLDLAALLAEEQGL
jgi:hypothetical protein